MRMLSVPLLVILACGNREYKYPDTFHPSWEAPEIRLRTGEEVYSFKSDFEARRPRVTLLFFGFTHCPDVCPLTMKRSADALAVLSPDSLKSIRFLFVTIDPARDDPATTRAYAKRFHPSMIGLSGTPDEVNLVKKQYGAYSGIQGGQVSHSSGLYWINYDGRVVKRIQQDDLVSEYLLYDLKVALH